MARYRPKFISQFGWGTRFDDENCCATAAAIMLDRQTEGAKTTTPPHIRSLIDSPNKSGGLSQTDAADALKRGWDEKLINPLPYEPWSQFLSMFREGRGAILFGDCSYKRGKMNCPGPVGELPPNHALYCQEDDKDGERILTYDPADHNAATGIQWLTYDTLRTYAGLWTHQTGFVNASYTSKISNDDGKKDDPGSPGSPAPDLSGCLGAFLPKMVTRRLIERGGMA
jgi:hypothetical protein